MIFVNIGLHLTDVGHLTVIGSRIIQKESDQSLSGFFGRQQQPILFPGLEDSLELLGTSTR